MAGSSYQLYLSVFHWSRHCSYLTNIAYHCSEIIPRNICILQYVLKKMDLTKASKREREAAEQEAQLLRDMKHPNIVAYKESFEVDNGYLYIAMGFCEGGDLYNRLKAQQGVPLEERQVVEWFVQIAMALQVCVSLSLVLSLMANKLTHK